MNINPSSSKRDPRKDLNLCTNADFCTQDLVKDSDHFSLVLYEGIISDSVNVFKLDFFDNESGIMDFRRVLDCNEDISGLVLPRELYDGNWDKYVLNSQSEDSVVYVRDVSISNADWIIEENCNKEVKVCDDTYMSEKHLNEIVHSDNPARLFLDYNDKRVKRHRQPMPMNFFDDVIIPKIIKKLSKEMNISLKDLKNDFHEPIVKTRLGDTMALVQKRSENHQQFLKEKSKKKKKKCKERLEHREISNSYIDKNWKRMYKTEAADDNIEEDKDEKDEFLHINKKDASADDIRKLAKEKYGDIVKGVSKGGKAKVPERRKKAFGFNDFALRDIWEESGFKNPNKIERPGPALAHSDVNFHDMDPIDIFFTLRENKLIGSHIKAIEEVVNKFRYPLNVVTYMYQVVNARSEAEICAAYFQFKCSFLGGGNISVLATGVEAVLMTGLMRLFTNGQMFEPVMLKTESFAETVEDGFDFLKKVFTSNYMAALQGLILTLTSYKFFSRDMASEIKKYIGTPEKLTVLGAMETVMKWIVSTIKIGEAICKGVPIKEAFFSTDPVEKLICEAEDLLVYENSLYSGLPVPGKMERRIYLMRSKKLIEECTIMLSKGNPYQASSKKLRGLNFRLTTALNRVMSYMNGSRRIPPISIILMGPPGVGKSKTINLAWMVYCRVKGWDFCDGMVFSKDPTTLFYEGHDPISQPFLFNSELARMNLNIAKQSGDPSMDDACSMVDGNIKMLNMAFEEKGKLYAAFALIQSDCNIDIRKGYLQALYGNPSAHARRPWFTTQSVKDEFLQKGTCMLDPQKSLDAGGDLLDRFWFKVEVSVATSSLHFEDVVIAEKIDVYEYCALLEKIIRKHLEIEEQMLQATMDNKFFDPYMKLCSFYDELRGKATLDEVKEEDEDDYAYDFYSGPPSKKSLTDESSPEYQCILTDDEIPKPYWRKKEKKKNMFESEAWAPTNHIRRKFKDKFQDFRFWFSGFRCALYLLFMTLMRFLFFKYFESFAGPEAKIYKINGRRIFLLLSFVSMGFHLKIPFYCSLAFFPYSLLLFMFINPRYIMSHIVDRVIQRNLEKSRRSLSMGYAALKYWCGIKTTINLLYNESRFYQAQYWIAAASSVLLLVKLYFRHARIENGGKTEAKTEFQIESKHNEELNIFEETFQCGNIVERVPIHGQQIWNTVMPGAIPPDTGTLENLENRISSSIRFCRIFVPGIPKPKRTYVFGIQGNLALINQHSLGLFKNSVRVEVACGSARCLDPEDETLVWHSTMLLPEYVVEVTHDILLVRLNGIVFKGKDRILKHIAEDTIHNGRFKAMIRGDEVQAIYKPERVGIKDPALGTLVLPHSFQYKWINHGPGFCGLPLIGEKGNGVCVLALHIAGLSGDARAVPITRSMVEVAIKKMSTIDNFMPIISISEKVEAIEDGGFTEAYTPQRTLNIAKSISKHSISRFEYLGGVEYVGRLPGKVCVNNVSRLKEFPLKDVLNPLLITTLGKGPEVEYAPPLMRPKYDEDGNYIYPYNIAIRKMARQKKPIRMDILNKVVEELVDRFTDGLSKQGIESLAPHTFEEAINGSEDGFSARRVNATTAGGHDFPGKKEKYLPIVCDDPDRIIREMDEFTKGKVENMINCMLNGEQPECIYSFNLKDEPRSFEKVKSGATRVFAASPLDGLIASKMFLGPIYSMMSRFRKLFCTGIGVNMYKGCDDMMREMHEFSAIFLEWDYKNYDQSMPFEIGWAAATVIWLVLKKLGYTAQALAVVQAILCSNLFPLCKMNGELFRVPGYQPSGKYGTAEDNSLRGLILLMYAWYSMPRTAPHNFFKFCLPWTYGDDLLMAIKNSMFIFFNNNTYQQFCRSVYGMEITSATKGKEMQPCLTILECSFLRRNFQFSVEYERWICPLNSDSLFRMVNWYLPSSNVTVDSQILDTLKSLLYELFLHVKADAFNAFRQEIAIILQKRGYDETDLEELLPNRDQIAINMFA